jgi:hypothetical protein
LKAFPAENPLSYQLMDKRIDYLYYAPMRLAFEPVYANLEESTAIY